MRPFLRQAAADSHSVIETEHISVFVGVAAGGQQVNYLSLPGDVVSRVHELRKNRLIYRKRS